MTDVFQSVSRLSQEQKRLLLAQLLEGREANVLPVYPLSYGQQALWFLHQLAPESGVYNEALVWRVYKKLHIPLLQRALQLLLNRHPVLRTIYVQQGDKPAQKVLEGVEVDFSVVDAATWSAEQIKEFLARERYQPIDLEHGPVFRTRLLTLNAQEHLLMLIVHHIAIDLWSFMVLLDELSQVYTMLQNEQPAQLPAPRTSYRDYVRWHLDMLAGPRGDELWQYWQKQLSDLPETLSLPADHPRPAIQTFAGASYGFTLSPQLSQRLQLLARSQGVTLYTLLLSAFLVLLYRYTGQDDILINSPTNGRTQARFDGTVGYFVNPVVMRGRMKGNLSFTAFLSQIQHTVMEALEHQEYPFPLLVDRLQPQRDASRAPLCDVAFVMEQTNRSTLAFSPDTQQVAGVYAEGATGAHLQLGEFDLELINVEQSRVKFDLELAMTLAGEVLSGSWQYNTDLFERATIVDFANHFQTLLQSILAEPDQRLERLPILAQDERQHLLNTWNTQPSTHFTDVSLHALIEQQAERTPDMPALAFADRVLSYRELNRLANRLAHYLRASGVGPGARVGLYVERSLEFVIGLVGVLKAGAAYVPLDPALPVNRLQFIIQDASLQLLLVQPCLQVPQLPPGTQVVALDTEQPDMMRRPDTNPAAGARPDDLAYIIYTSGSTGEPKGVLIHHRSLVNYTLEMQRRLACMPGWHFATVSTPSADLGNTSIFCALTTGGCLHVLSQQIATDSQAFAQYTARHPIDVIKLTPSHLHALLLGGPQVLPQRVLILGGEALPWTLIAQIQATGARCAVLNHYGPTETTIGVLVNNLGPAQALSQAREERATATVHLCQSLAHTQAYILDEHLQPVPVGVPGELFIGGAGLASGYCNRPDLTAERFIPHPFSTEPGARLYRTGDLVRRWRDGSIEFLRRKDRQVKLRGFRVEPGEIEHALALHPAIRECVVQVAGASPNERLVAYLVARSQPAPSTGDLRRWLQDRLPDYMIPAVFMYLDAFPLGPNGKLDTRALPPPDHLRPMLETRYQAPKTALEQSIVQIWQDVLQLEQVGIQDNFFDLGGSSLLMCQAHQRLRTTLQRDIALVTLFRYPTVGSLADFLGQGPQPSRASQDGYDRASSRLLHRNQRRQSGRGQFKAQE